MTLAYVFWHQAADVDGYEESLLSFHDSLPIASASFRLARLPFLAESGYEDWYLVDGWEALGPLGRVALETGTHDPIAAMSGDGWGGVWAPVSGSAEIPEGSINWVDKPRGVPYGEFFAGLGADTIWCRQLVLGPAPEVAVVSAGPSDARVRIA
jgi:hypothetical protein